MGRACVFCGRPPTAGNKEHILPKWLLRLTGDPNRWANFGPKFGKPGEAWEFSFNSFQLPACRKCNDEGAKLEDKAAPLVAALLRDGELNGHQLSTLLDWLDKVRIGLWLAHSMLDKNVANVRPQFYIQRRLRLFDRALVVYRCKEGLPPLGFGGTFGPSFQYSPVAFSLRVRHLVLVNASYASLCSPELGFPYFHSGEYLTLGGAIEYRVAPPANIFQAPFCSSLPPIPSGGAVFLQPVFAAMLETTTSREVLVSHHVKRFSAGMPPGAGQVFQITTQPDAIPVANRETVQVVPAEPISNRTALLKTLEFALDAQRLGFARAPSVTRLSPKERSFFDAHLPAIERANEFIKGEAAKEFLALNYV